MEPILTDKASDSHLASDDSHANRKREDQTHRKLRYRHVQLIGIGGSIGTALFVQIGSGLAKGGPASLFLAFTIWSTVIMAVNNCLTEMITWIPISSPFIRFADRFVDPAFGFCAGINFFVYEAILVPFEATAFNLLVQFWTDKIPTAAVIVFLIVAYALLNFFAVRFYGESEFWLSIGKALLAVGLIAFTFITMVGGNPQHDPYGFRNFNPSKVEGSPFAEFMRTGSLGRFLGFLACLIQASFVIAGPEYVAMTAGEAEAPRKTMPTAFNGVFYRVSTFFILGSLCVGIIIPYNDPDLMQALSNPQSGVGSSPYIIAMSHLGIKVLPHIVNALVMTSIFSAGNSYAFCASRTLFGLALEGKAPRFLTWCNADGVPVYCVLVVLTVTLLSFLQVSSGSAVVIQWLVNFVTASQLLNYAIISFTYIRFHRALAVQGIPRESLPHRSFWQPFCGYYAFIGTLTMAFVGGYTVFMPGNWATSTFIFSYAMICLIPIMFVIWKGVHRTKWHRPEDVTFFPEERAKVDEYEQSFLTP